MCARRTSDPAAASSAAGVGRPGRFSVGCIYTYFTYAYVCMYVCMYVCIYMYRLYKTERLPIRSSRFPGITILQHAPKPLLLISQAPIIPIITGFLKGLRTEFLYGF